MDVKITSSPSARGFEIKSKGSEKYTVALFPAGSEVCLEARRALQYLRHFSLVGLTSTQDYSDAVYDRLVCDMPFVDDPDFFDRLKGTVREQGIDFLVPGMDEVAFLLKEREPELGCKIVYADLETARILRRKSATYDALNDIVPTPEVLDFDALDENALPVFTKPDIGYGSRGARLIDTTDALDAISEKEKQTNVFLEHLPGLEVTIDCFSDSAGNLLFHGARRRARVRMGISVSTYPVEGIEDLRKSAENISSRLEMKGCWFFQMKQDRFGTYKLLEVAHRVSGTMSLFRMLGINFLALDLYQRIGSPVTIPTLLPVEASLQRAFDVRLVGKFDVDSVYVDLDDCIILDGKVNTHLIAFLFTCINKKLPITLVTRHEGDPEKTLREFKLRALFDRIVHLKNDEAKSSVIDHDRPLFIDDSFRERAEVASNSQAICLALDMLDEGLL